MSFQWKGILKMGSYHREGLFLLVASLIALASEPQNRGIGVALERWSSMCAGSSSQNLVLN